MKLFLTVVRRHNSTSSSDATPTDDVALFDPGVWSRTTTSEMARRNVSASYVAQQVYRHAALTQLAKAALEGAVCFRYGPRPPTHLDSFLFHKRSRLTEHGRSGTLPAAAAAPPVCTSSPLISSSCSSFSVSMTATSPRTGQKRSTAAGASGSATEYDSLLALWLRELLSGTGISVTVTALLLFVDGTAIDMATGSEVHKPLNVGSGTARQLRTHEDAMAFLHACESTIRHSAAEFPRCPYHVCVAVLVGAHGGSHRRNTVTFLDVAAAAPESAGAEEEVRLREQVALFGRQLGAEAATATPHACQRTRKAEDEQWLSLLQSCQLSRASLVGLVYIACEAGHDSFGHFRVEENGCDPFTLVSVLRQRALLEAVNNDVLHLQLRKPSHAQKRANARSVKLPTGDATTTSRAPDSPPKGRPSRGRQRPQQHRSRLPYLTRGSVPPRRAQEHSIVFCGFPRCSRSVDPLARIGREERHARVALSSAEQRARKLAELRWILRAHPPGKSIDAMLRRLAHNVNRVSRPEQQHPHSVPPRFSPPPLNEAQLATAINRSSTTATRWSSFTSPMRTPESTSPGGTVRKRVAASMLPTSPSCPALASPYFTRRITTPLFFREAGSPPQNQDDPRAHSVSSRAAVRGHTAAGLERRRLNSGASFSLATGSPNTHTYTSARRLSAIETALLARAHSSNQRSLPSHSPRMGEVERLYPLVHAFHVEMCEQDTLMAEELMMRSRIEHKEKNCRKTLSFARAESVRRPSVLWPSETGTQPQREPQVPHSPRWRPAKPRPLRIFFQH
ncbi:hypothetical protein, unknown function [Leishmania infantum JPCM5]|uniref:Uncharacterized protein n=2 Tax=Leishmania infantum TaxID=5671 RepID=A4HT13_LEIIN|nr:hypothetical protein, unknown function [Leishmania infantum JPCM5]CAC9447194.1 hypothetical_protein_-_conserved [Leishmania infantum]CAM65557.1 hypothetical protein, unknown function [Leishmania infantum JPCM5]SUZ39173.1 hypothetical_protein_-_conserved [Leishmania infantum]|eukprot:XP_001463204.1 hypothetical protein, unknown function [Leishmania infantum JPCM5]